MTAAQDQLDTAVEARALELGMVWPTPDPDPVPDPTPAEPVTVTGLKVSGAQVGNNVTATVSTSTVGTVSCELAVAVRAAVNPVDSGDLDFTHLAGTSLHADQTFSFAKAFTKAGDYVAHVAYLDGTGWKHLSPLVPFTVAASTPTPDPTPDPTPSTNILGSVGARSGKTWNSGIWPLNRAGSAASFTSNLQYAEGRRGFKSDINMAAQYYNSWADLEGLQILQFLAAADLKCVPVLMLPPFPSGGSWTAAARGDYDAHYKTMGAKAASIMGDRKWASRTAWECNGNWYPWSIVSAGGAAAFKAGFARMIQQMRAGMGAKAANHISVYSLSNLDDKGQGDPLTVTCPDLSVVDVVGIDPYDHWQVYGQPAGSTGKIPLLQRVVDFTKQHGKSWSVDEWGVHHTNGTDPEGKDNPAYITAMYKFIRANSANLAWEQYFQDDAMNNVNSSLFSPTKDDNPNSRAAYLAAVK